MTLLWVALAAAGLVSLIVRSRYRSRKASDLGTVSHQWLSEQRLRRSDSASQR
jgi:hypothetical protein